MANGGRLDARHRAALLGWPHFIPVLHAASERRVLMEMTRFHWMDCIQQIIQ